jgi:peptidoglycan hydrolase-like protein with peptidoglycan-binding domain
MRFNEFKLVEQDQKAGFYTVGDSHAVGLANYAGKPWVSKGKNGTRSTDPMHKAAIATIPKGSTVAISLGANDAQDTKANPQSIATSVAGVIDAAKQQGLKVHFVLFPIGTQANGQFRAAVRDAIKSMIDVPITDLEGSKLVDGIHADGPSYKKVAATITSDSPLGPAGAAPGAPATKDKEPVMRAFRADGSFYVPMLVGNKGPEVADLQKALLALGYQLPKYGVDGIVGRETKDAIRAFQTDKKLQVDGIAGKETITAVNNTITANPKVASSLKQSTQADVKARVQNVATGDAKGGAGATGSATTALKFFISKGWTTEQAAGIVGNLQAESGANLKTDAVGDAGQAYGIAQWHPPRQKDFTKTTGKDIRGSSLQDQLTFVDWELNNTERNAGRHLKAAKTAEEAAWVMDEYYERSTGAHRQNRINNAVALASTTTTTA